MNKLLCFFAFILSTAFTHAAVVDFDLSPPGHGAAPGLSPLNEVIPGLSSGSGGEVGSGIRFDTGTLMLTLSIGYGSQAGFMDLTTPAFSWLLHGPAPPDQTAPVLFDLASLHTFAPDHSRGGFLMGSLMLTPTQASDLLGGFNYINIYTPANLGGEIRGQLVPVPEPAAWVIAIAGGLLFIGRALFRYRIVRREPAVEARRQ